MIANFFSKSKPVNIFNLVILLFLYFVVGSFLAAPETLLLSYFLSKLFFFIGFVIFLIVANFIIKRNNLTLDNLYGLLLIVLLLGTFKETMFSNKIIFSNFILLLSYRKIYSLKSGLNIAKKLFDAGFWIGVATIIYPNSILYLFLIFTAIIIYQKTDFKNFLVPLAGCIAPLFLFFTYNFYFDKTDAFLSIFRVNIGFDFTAYNQLKILIPLAFLITITLWSLVVVTPKIVLISNNLRMSWNVLLNQLIVATVVVFIAPIKNGSELLFLLFPYAIVISNFLQKSQSSNFKNLILYIFFAISIAVYFL
ncbi:DUF6427 family protein [Lutibacter sp.]|uniref:DUF6427 family protein n=1 Tax=Lutibacter sp. TaxID=1925666 RepID=UPI003567BDCA